MLKISFLFVIINIFLNNLVFCDDFSSYRSAIDAPGPYDNFHHSIRDVFFNIGGKRGLRIHGGFLQDPFPEVIGFPCHLVNMISEEVPTSVHKLRPGDIDVVAAMGDSITVAVGAIATNILEMTTENRGFSWSIGGQWDWRNATTLPNILRVFNPNIVGFSLGDALPFHSDSQFNVAEVGAVSADLPYMAEVLVKRIKEDPRVDFYHHWKMLTIMIGGNDICSLICTLEKPEMFPENYKQRLIKTLNYIRDSMPRTYVNIIPLPPLQDIVLLDDKPERCQLLHLMECSCWLGNLYNYTDSKRDLYRSIQKQTWQVEKDVAQMYRGNDNFTVVYQPFTEKFSIRSQDGRDDFTLLAFDCFHLSQKGNAWAGTALWNNLNEASGNKSKQWGDPRNQFLCPSMEKPYFHTYDNDNFHSPL